MDVVQKIIDNPNLVREWLAKYHRNEFMPPYNVETHLEAYCDEIAQAFLQVIDRK